MPLDRMIRVGKIKGLAPVDAQGAPTLLGVGAPKNSKSGKARLFQVQIGPQLKTAQLVPPAGEDVSPPDGSTAILLESGGWLYMIASADDVEPDETLKRGEKEIRSTNGNGDRAIRLKLKSNGKAYLANAGQNLKAALQTLVEGIQGASYIPYPGGAPGPAVPIIDATGKLATALTQLQALLDDSP